MGTVFRFACLILLASNFAAPAQGEGRYHRFYQGYLVSGLSIEGFEEAANRDFLPLFPKAHPEGLVAYRPALVSSPADCKLPVWIALLTFESEPVYQKYTQSEIGKAIRAAHAPVFDGKASKSAVPVPFQGVIEPGQAYDLKSSFDAYASAESALILHCGEKGGLQKSLESIAKAYSSPSAAENILFVVSPSHVSEYVFAKTRSDLDKAIAERKKRFEPVFAEFLAIPLLKQRVGTEALKRGHGLDAQW